MGQALERLREALNRDPSIRWAYLFGSAARAEPFRDLDIGVVLKDTESHSAVRFGALVAALEAAVPDFPLDVVELTSASPALRAAAVQQGRLLVDSDPDARKDWETHVARIWLDLAPWIARGQVLRLEALRRKAG
jgi:predicted nucleotidyltransferase